MNADYVALKNLESHPGYAILCQLWIHQISRIEEARDKAAKQSSHKAESDWRYMAGQEKGFKLAMTAVARAIVEMEQKMKDEIENEETTMDIDKLLGEIKKQ